MKSREQCHRISIDSSNLAYSMA